MENPEILKFDIKEATQTEAEKESKLNNELLEQFNPNIPMEGLILFTPFVKLLKANATEETLISYIKSDLFIIESEVSGFKLNPYFLLCMTESFKRGYLNCVEVLFSKIESRFANAGLSIIGDNADIMSYFYLYSTQNIRTSKSTAFFKEMRPFGQYTVSLLDIAVFKNNNSNASKLIQMLGYKRGDVSPYIHKSIDLKGVNDADYLATQCKDGNLIGVLKSLVFANTNPNTPLLKAIDSSTSGLITEETEIITSYPLYEAMRNILSPLQCDILEANPEQQLNYTNIQTVMLAHGASKELALFAALRHRDSVTVECLMSQGVDLNCRDEDGNYTPLMTAVKLDDIRLVATLMSSQNVDHHFDANLNPEDPSSTFYQKIDLELKDLSGKTAIDLATESPQASRLIKLINLGHLDPAEAVLNIYYDEFLESYEVQHLLTPEGKENLIETAENLIRMLMGTPSDDKSHKLFKFIMAESGTKKLTKLRFSMFSVPFWQSFLKKHPNVDLSITDESGKTLLESTIEDAKYNELGIGNQEVELIRELLQLAPFSIQGGQKLLSQPQVIKQKRLLRELGKAKFFEMVKNEWLDFLKLESFEPTWKLFTEFLEKSEGSASSMDKDIEFSVACIQNSTDLIRKIRKRFSNSSLRDLESIRFSWLELNDILIQFSKDNATELEKGSITVSDLTLAIFNSSKEVQEIEAETERAQQEQDLKKTKIEIHNYVHRANVRFYEAKIRIEQQIGSVEQVRVFVDTAYNEANTFINNLGNKKSADKQRVQNAQKTYKAKKEGADRVVNEYKLYCDSAKKLETTFDAFYKEQKLKIEQALDNNDIKAAEALYQTIEKTVEHYAKIADNIKMTISSFKDVLAGIRTFTQTGMKTFNPKFKPKSDRERTDQSKEEESKIDKATQAALTKAESDLKSKFDEIEKARLQDEEAREKREKERQEWKAKQKAVKLAEAEAKRLEEQRQEKKSRAEESAKAALAAHNPSYRPSDYSATYTPNLKRLQQSSSLQSNPAITALPVYNHFVVIEKLLTEMQNRDNTQDLYLDRERDALRFAIADLCEEIRKLPQGFVLDKELAASFRHSLFKGPRCSVDTQEDLTKSLQYNGQLRNMVKSLLQILREQSTDKSGNTEVKTLSEETLTSQMNSPLFVELLECAKKFPPKESRPVPSQQELLAEIEQIYNRLETYKKMSGEETILLLAEKYCISLLGVASSLIRDHYRDCYTSNKIIYDQYIENANNLRHGQDPDQSPTLSKTF